MPLNSIGQGNMAMVRRVSGNADVRRYLENLGFIAGTEVTLISSIGGNVIVGVKGSCIAINSEMARHILV